MGRDWLSNMVCGSEAIDRFLAVIGRTVHEFHLLDSGIVQRASRLPICPGHALRTSDD
jgi:hypothetical protein